MPHGLPSMDALRLYLCEHLKVDSKAESDAWSLVKSDLAKGDHLEEALKDKNLPDTLLTKIVALTWQCVNCKDKSLLDVAASNGNKFPLGRLLLRMFNSTHSKIHVVTTNYDRVTEYACNSVGILFQTGFTPGYVQKWESTGQVGFIHNRKASRVVKIWKVHGSLD